MLIKKLLFLCLMLSASAFCKEKLPYSLSCNSIVQNPESTDDIDVDFLFYNNSNKQIESLTVVMLLNNFDWIYEIYDDNLKFEVEEKIASKEYIDFSQKISGNFQQAELDDSFIEYFYVSLIRYSDGTVWTDPFGIKKY